MTFDGKAWAQDRARGCVKPKRPHLEYFPSMSSPSITQPPNAVFVAVEYPDLAVNRPSRTPVTVGVECHCLDQIVMAMLHNKFKLGAFLRSWRLPQSRCHASLSDARCGWKITFRRVETELFDPSSGTQPTREALGDFGLSMVVRASSQSISTVREERE